MKKCLIYIVCSFLFGCGSGENTKPDLNVQISKAIKESEFQRKMAEKESFLIAEEMNKYGLSYFNEVDRIRFLTLRRQKGELKMQNELNLAKERNKKIPK